MFLENFYGTLFYPADTFEKLKSNPSLLTGLAIVGLVSMLNPVLRADEITPLLSVGLISVSFGGIIKWAFFAFFIEILACIFNRGGKIEILLALSAYALLPWIFIAPIALFKTGGLLAGLLGALAGIAVWIWTTALTVFAVMKAYDISSERVLLLIFVPLLGFIIFFDWIIGFFSTLGSIISV